MNVALPAFPMPAAPEPDPLALPRPPVTRPEIIRLGEADLRGLTDAEILDRVQAAHAANVLAAREDSGCFVEFAIPNEETGEPVRNAALHRDWHDTINANRQVVLIAPVEHGKTSQIGVGKLLHALGTNPNGRYALISNTAPQAEKLLGAIRAHIERNPLVQEVFPHLRASDHAEAKWGQSQITIERDRISRDPSIQALGVGGPLVGSRLDGILLDDVLDFENTRTPEQCAKLVEWFETTVITRLTRHGWIVVIGTPWTTIDLLSELAKRKGWVCKTYSAVENPDDPPDRWRPIWPEGWPLQRLLDRMAGMLPLTFARKYLCRVRSDESSRFRPEWIENAKALGRGRTLLPRRPVMLPSGRKLPCFTGVDLGNSPRKRKLGAGADLRSGLSVLFTIAIDERARRIPVEIQAGRWTGPEILTRIHGVYERYESQIIVEDNGTQAFIVQFAGARSIPVIPFTTTAGAKYDETFGIDSIAVEFRSGLWIVPSGPDGATVDPEVSAWLSEALHYTPEAHTGDRLMASWFAREGARSLIASLTKHMPTLDR